MSPGLHPLRDGLLLALCITASVTDLRSRRIPDLLTFPAMAIAITLAWVSHGLAGTLSSLFGLLVCGMVMGLAGLAGGMGGGDVKLMAAVGAVLGFPLALFALLY
ncbi:MAG: prepilin peptidase, partial [Deltaproteobacteria bacterium]|nr:prepilin peptidase [Deltaproteobacteria bacterium]